MTHQNTRPPQRRCVPVRHAVRTGLLAFSLGLAAMSLTPADANANMALDKVILDFQPGEILRDDIEVSNQGEETLFITIAPSEIVNPGTENQNRVSSPDPRKMGLLATPNRMILKPGERRLVRVASLGRPSGGDRIYRLTVKPVVGEVKSEETALKLLIGYDVLIMVRPANPQADLHATRDGRRIAFENTGNTNLLLFRGEQCEDPADLKEIKNGDDQEDSCVDLPTRRIYAGNHWEVDLPFDTPARFFVSDGQKTSARTF